MMLHLKWVAIMKTGWWHKEIGIENNGLLHKGEEALWGELPFVLTKRCEYYRINGR